MTITKRPLSYWVKTSNLKIQILLLIVILITVTTRVIPLEMQKKIVNHAIGQKKLDLLFLYCGFYLASVVIASGMKFVITYLQTALGQQALARMRKEMFEHILKLPLSFFRKTSSGLVVSSLVTEVVTASEFVGQAVAVPVTNLLTLLAFGGYMFYLNPLLACLSLIIYPLVIAIVPRMQRRSNEANKQRVDVTRRLSSKIGETISGIHEIHANGSYHIENRKYGKFVDELMKVRIVWTLYKQGIKTTNNFFQNLGPFFLFIVGGYLAIQGRFDLGALVAFLSAQDKLYDPWKELMDFYQTYQDATVSYTRLMEYYDLEPEHPVAPIDRDPYELKGEIQVKDLSFTVAGGIQLLKQVSLDLKPGEQLALVGFSGSGKSTLAQCISQLYTYTGGSVQIDGLEVNDLTKQDLARNLGVVAQSPFIFDGTIKENLLYSCTAVIEDGDPAKEYKYPTLDEMIEVIQQVGLFVDVLRFGLNTLLEADQESELVDKLIRVRENFQADFGKELSDFVEFFDEESYLYFSSVAANLIFGNPNQPEFSPDQLHNNQYFLDFLDEAQLKHPLVSLGYQLAEQTMDILGNLPPDEMFFQQSPILADEFDDFKALVGRGGAIRLHEFSEEDQHGLLKLALRFVPGIHKIVALPQMLEHLILDGRFLFMKKIQADHPDAISFYRISEYIHSQTILDNILYGKPRTDHPKSQERINQSIIQLLIEEDLLERIVEIGMNFRVGTKGDRLSGGQRQKLAIARIFLKAPPILIMDEATSALDNASQKRIQNLLETKWKGKSTLISVIHRLDTIKGYDKIGVMKAGKIIEMGTYDELLAKKGVLYEFVHGAKAGAQ
ncbi:ABC transporter ATP-binding protein/permease [Desulfoferrobacter suflitae]|uniref:ABC transporter ATP-binding protein/permease n=1 Tax=Desulfoferrobacter suflitae TaxID=2865782 RepID=UPI00216423CA|nr:ABC transporter ATP-binding protein/permease [Desulfoferrobacter suflitae]MCK8601675.1 ABC transporter ATP-binding protein/permease [Desulfoferrobacter suflitae]